MITVTAFKWVPPFAQGNVRDLRVRWALEEAGIPYQERLVDFQDTKTPEYRSKQPFGQVPVFEEDGMTLFESGAIVLHLAERSPTLAPKEPEARAQVSVWIFAALNSVEAVVGSLTDIDLFAKGEAWAEARRPQVVAAVSGRLKELATHLGDRQYLVADRFTAADIVMATVLHDVPKEILGEFSGLSAYLNRCEDRPAYKKALAAQLAPFKKFSPKAKN